MYLLTEEQLKEVASAVSFRLDDSRTWLAHDAALQKASEIEVNVGTVTVSGSKDYPRYSVDLKDLLTPQQQPSSIPDIPREDVAAWPKNRRRAYHIMRDTKNLAEDHETVTDEHQKQQWFHIACTARLALLSLGAETKEMTGMKEIVDGLAAKLDAANKQIADLERQVVSWRTAWEGADEDRNEKRKGIEKLKETLRALSEEEVKEIVIAGVDGYLSVHHPDEYADVSSVANLWALTRFHQIMAERNQEGSLAKEQPPEEPPKLPNQKCWCGIISIEDGNVIVQAGELNNVEVTAEGGIRCLHCETTLEV